ncbi:NADH dehydrogenase subunit 6 (mitochondrion) [Eretmochelys imbricata]|uniref:NADH-ubiquinone oxidoreductase chain 6 n=1 Tax=Eretmochelys imbricata TaxID=27787 RepID=B6JUD2_EREIM|nr:NADH dehydrogenase subunit 6 [Eretmochelys imbricata]ABF66064.1 NADH dehydrogenase subunit 6 [Eretmochelys imbricata]
MMYFAFLFGFCFVFWMVGVSCNPSPYYGVLSLVLGAAFGCGLLVSMGGSFVSVVLFLIYLGGMLVIFAYSSALVEEPYPVAWGNRGGVVYVYDLCFSYCKVWGNVLLTVEYGKVWWCYNWCWWVVCCSVKFWWGSVVLFGSWLFLIAGWGLLLTLFVVMELVRGLSRGVLRPI